MLGWCATLALAQPAEVWTQAALRAPLDRTWSVVAKQHVRVVTGEDLGWDVLTDLGARARLRKGVRTALVLRGGARQREGRTWDPRVRVHADLRGRLRQGPVRLTLRPRLQVWLPIDDETATWTARGQATVSLDVGDVRLWGGVEPFAEFGTERIVDRSRFEGGLRLDLPDRVDVEAWYRREIDYGVDRQHIVGVGLTKALRRRKREAPTTPVTDSR